MTRKEFAEKYNVDYNIVVQASKSIRICQREKNAQFSENDLGIAICNELRGRMHRYMEAAGRTREDYDRLRVICWQCAVYGEG